MQQQFAFPPPVPEMFVALDGMDVDEARTWVKAMRPHCKNLKVGMELLEQRGGLELALDFKQWGMNVFMDAKRHDTGKTMERTVRRAALNGWDYYTLHCPDRDTADAILEGLADAPMQPLLITVLTSRKQRNLCDEGLGGHPLPGLVARRADQFHTWGLTGAVASARHIPLIRNEIEKSCTALKQVPHRFLIASPGCRLPEDPATGQSKPVTPQEARAYGAHVVVVGDPITRPHNGDSLGALLRYTDALQQEPAR